MMPGDEVDGPPPVREGKEKKRVSTRVTVGSAAEPAPICYLGDFGPPPWRRFVERECTVLRLADLPVARITSDHFAELPPKTGDALLRRAALVVLDPASPRLLEAVEETPAPLLLRLFDRRRRRRVIAFFRRRAIHGGRRILVAPADAPLRRVLAAELGEAALTPGDWGPLLDSFPGGRGRSVTGIRPRFRGPPDAIARMRRRLAGIGDLAERGSAREVLLFVGEPEMTTAPIALAVDALERGTPVLATPPWKEALGEAAVFLSEEGLVDLLRVWARDPGHAARAAVEARDRLRERLGEEAFLARLRALLPESAAEREGSAPPPRDVDLLLVGNLARSDEVGLHLAARAHEASSRGRRVAFLHLPSPPPGLEEPPDPAIRALVRSGRAFLVGPGSVPPRARRLEIHDIAACLPLLERHRPLLRADEWIVHEGDDGDAPEAASERQERLRSLYGCSPRWSSSSPSRWRLLAGRVPMAPSPSPPPAVPVARPGLRCGPPVLGTVLFDEAAVEEVVSRYAEPVRRAGWRLRLLLRRSDGAPSPPRSGEVEIVDLPGFDLARFLGGLDGALWPAGLEESRLSPIFYASAAKAGLPVFAPPGVAVPYLRHTVPIDRLAKRAARKGTPKARRGSAPTRSRRILFVTANGVGLGHVTRLAAIARHLPPDLEPVFATMSQAVGVLRRLGFFAELLPTYTGHPHDVWNRWLRRRMEELLDYHRPAAVVLDASNPYDGVLEAVAPRPDTRLVWIRRGMWRPEQDNAAFLARAPCFDLVIEPGELAAERDRGATAARRDEVLAVDPIGLLEETDLFPREEARRLLGLRSDLPAVLLQLGSGTTRDVAHITDAVVASLRRAGSIEIVIARWMIADDEFDEWPDVRRLHGFPIGRYFRAFDFTVSAAGYNSFHDILRFGLPAIFVPNEAEFMDDQEARAALAQDAGAAFDLRTSDLDCLDDCIRAMLDPTCRAVLRDNARALARPNGADQAARAIVTCLEGPRAGRPRATVTGGMGLDACSHA